MEFVKERGIPIPARKSRAKWTGFTEQFAKLKIGESILVTPDNTNKYYFMDTLRSHGLRHFIGCYQVRRLEDEKVRVWKIAEPKPAKGKE